jgi:hypothetical protein
MGATFREKSGLQRFTISEIFVRDPRENQVPLPPDQRPHSSAGWRDALEAIPTVFGRLVYLRSLPDCSELPIGHTALQVFASWLRLGLSEQVRDLRAYLAASGGLTHGDFSRLVPPAARDVERLLFLTDMETLVGLLRVEGDTPPSVL